MKTIEAHAGYAPRARSAEWRDVALLMLPCLLLAAVALPFAYRTTLAEPDLVRMMAALVYGQSTGLQEAAGMHYGMKFSFGYYHLLYALAPAGWLESPDLAAQLINAVGIASGLACAAACTAYLAALFGQRVALAAAIVFLLSPMMLPLALSGHPLIPAAACLFLAGWWLVQAEDRHGAAHAACLAMAAALLLFSLTLRAEVVLAFPFLLLAARRAPDRLRAAWVLYGTRAALLAGAFIAFLWLQHAHVSESGGAAGALIAFMKAFMSPERTVRGMAVLGLSSGLATLGVALWAVLRTPSQARELWLPLVLGLPALVFWLPNPQPARHFFFPVLALALLVALFYGRSRLAGTRAWLAAPLVLVLANQLVAELVRPLIVAGYEWSYAAVTQRRATQHVPIGLFPLDQRANQAQAELQRREAMHLARHVPDRLIVLADSQHYLAAHLIAAIPDMKAREGQWNGSHLVELRSPSKTVLILDKYPVWPRDLTAEVLQEPLWKDWQLYVQPFSQSRHDRTAVPPERRLVLN